MENKYVLVSGGSKGIGYGIVQNLIKNGYYPIILDIIEPENLSNILYYEVDFLDLEGAKAVLKKICAKYEILRLVNNVGIVKPDFLEHSKLEDYLEVIKINSMSAIICLQAVLPSMEKAKFGRVVSITSRTILGKEKRTAYSASKGAITSMTRTWALELASSKITVNAIAPGPIETEAFLKNNPLNNPKTQAIIKKIPLKRMGTACDIGNAVNFFINEESSFITGQTLYVCGGITVGLLS